MIRNERAAGDSRHARTGKDGAFYSEDGVLLATVDTFTSNVNYNNAKYSVLGDAPEVTAMLSLSIQRHICPNSDPRIYWAREVTFDYATTNAVRVDFMKFKPVNNTVSGIEKGDFYCYEVKSSVEDFHSKNGHNFLGDYNYYVMPKEVYEQIKKEIPCNAGQYEPGRC